MSDKHDEVAKLLLGRAFSLNDDGKQLADFLREAYQPTPRPLSKGDWVYFSLDDKDKTLCYYMGYGKCLTINGNEWTFRLEHLTRIERLTEEHLKMLDGEMKYEIVEATQHKGYWIEGFTCSERCYLTKIFPSKHEAISECLFNVIAVRKQKREMGV